MKELRANLTVIDHLKDVLRDQKSFDQSECLKTICEAQVVILKNQEEIFSKIDELKK